jgi:hypothetical protein
MMSWIQTFSGRSFHPLDPKASDVAIEDIAHALAMKCRFGGHCPVYYSVAEHSVRVSRRVPKELALWGLMHDAGEAYLPDVGAPIKDNVFLHIGGEKVAFHVAEDRILAVIAEALKFPAIDYNAIRVADLELLATEARDLMAEPPEPWNLGVKPLRETIVPLATPAAAKEAFLTRFRELHP